MNDIVTIIIPAYNVEKYIQRCINSVVAQTYTNLEIIIINDGSTDETKEICNQAEINDKRIRVYHEKNKGLSEARNKGIKLAKGKFLMFLDSDDYLELYAIEKLVFIIEKYELDVLEFNANKIYKEKIEKMHKEGMNKNENQITNGIKYYLNSIKDDNFLASACFKIVKRQIIIDNDLFFKPNWLHEDELWSAQLMIKIKRISYFKETLYNYYIHNNSITHSNDMTKNLICYIDNCIILEKIFSEQIQDKNDKKKLKDYLSRQYMASFRMQNYKYEYIKNYINKKFPIKNSYYITTIFMAIFFLVSPKYYIKIQNKILCIRKNNEKN